MKAKPWMQTSFKPFETDGIGLYFQTFHLNEVFTKTPMFVCTVPVPQNDSQPPHFLDWSMSIKTIYFTQNHLGTFNVPTPWKKEALSIICFAHSELIVLLFKLSRVAGKTSCPLSTSILHAIHYPRHGTQSSPPKMYWIAFSGKSNRYEVQKSGHITKG